MYECIFFTVSFGWTGGDVVLRSEKEHLTHMGILFFGIKKHCIYYTVLVLVVWLRIFVRDVELELFI